MVTILIEPCIVLCNLIYGPLELYRTAPLSISTFQCLTFWFHLTLYASVHLDTILVPRSWHKPSLIRNVIEDQLILRSSVSWVINKEGLWRFLRYIGSSLLTPNRSPEQSMCVRLKSPKTHSVLIVQWHLYKANLIVVCPLFVGYRNTILSVSITQSLYFSLGKFLVWWVYKNGEIIGSTNRSQNEYKRNKNEDPFRELPFFPTEEVP